MALGTIAPWLQLPDFISAAHAGASIGLQQRKAADDLSMERAKLQQSAIESSGRLGLGYTEAENAARRAQAEQDLAKATLALHQSRYSDLSKQADERHQLGLDRLDALEGNRDVVNTLHQDQLDSLNEHRGEVDALRGTRPTASGAKTPTSKPFMVKVPIPANAETGEAATTVSLPSNHPAAQAYLKAHGLGDVPPESASGLYTPPETTQGGETLPLPDGTAQAAQALQPRNLIYEGSKADGPPSDQLPSNISMGSQDQPAIAEPGPMPPETLAQPPAKVLDKATASTFLKQAKGDKGAARRLAREAGYQF